MIPSGQKPVHIQINNDSEKSFDLNSSVILLVLNMFWIGFPHWLENQLHDFSVNII